MKAVRQLEECPLFNAGKGAVFTQQGTHELDASIIDGRMLEVGAVAGVSHIRNPVLVARKALENSPRVLFIRVDAVAASACQRILRADYASCLKPVGLRMILSAWIWRVNLFRWAIRARRYSNHKVGRQYGADSNELPRTCDQERPPRRPFLKT